MSVPFFTLSNKEDDKICHFCERIILSNRWFNFTCNKCEEYEEKYICLGCHETKNKEIRKGCRDCAKKEKEFEERINKMSEKLDWLVKELDERVIMIVMILDKQAKEFDERINIMSEKLDSQAKELTELRRTVFRHRYS